MRLEEALGLAERRIRLAKAVQSGAGALLAAALFYAAVVLALQLFRDQSTPWWWLVLPVGIGALAFLLAFMLKRPSRFQVAAALDKRLHLAESATTAVHAASTGASLDEAWSRAVAEQADRRAERLHPVQIAVAFRLPSPRWAMVAALIVAIGHFVAPHLPLIAAKSAIGAKDAEPKKKVAEAKVSREAARRLEARAKELERAAELRGLERARAAAQKVAIEAKKLANQTTSKRDALTQLSQIAAAVDKAREDMLGKAGDRQGLTQPPEEDILSRIASELDEMAPDDLDADLKAFALDVAKEAAAAKAEGRHARMDAKKLDELLKRLDKGMNAMKSLEELMQEFPELAEELEKITKEQMEALRRISEKLKKFAGPG